MSSRQVSIADLRATLATYPPDMLVVLDTHCDPLEAFEGMFDGPSQFRVIDVVAVRSGMNPENFDRCDSDSMKALLIRAW
jgi:hypothetical protein